jgi:hypothetical protein
MADQEETVGGAVQPTGYRCSVLETGGLTLIEREHDQEPHYNLADPDDAREALAAMLSEIEGLDDLRPDRQARGLPDPHVGLRLLPFECVTLACAGTCGQGLGDAVDSGNHFNPDEIELWLTKSTDWVKGPDGLWRCLDCETERSIAARTGLTDDSE